MKRIPRYHIFPSVIIVLLIFIVILSGIFMIIVNFDHLKEIDSIPNWWYIVVFAFIVTLWLWSIYIKGLFIQKYVLTKNFVSFGKHKIAWEETLALLVVESHFKGQHRKVETYSLSLLKEASISLLQSYIFISKIPFEDVIKVKWYQPIIDCALPTENYFFIPYSKKNLDRIIQYRQQRIDTIAKK